MDRAILRTLNEPTRALIAETERSALRRLDEEALSQLHARVSRQRNKYTKLYRRRASAEVGRRGSRGVARLKHPRTAAKAELYEVALARVSEALAAAARNTAAEMRAKRRQEAFPLSRTPPRAVGLQHRGPARGTRDSRFTAAQRSPHSTFRTPIGRKRHASTRAMGARRQARRDSR